MRPFHALVIGVFAILMAVAVANISVNNDQAPAGIGTAAPPAASADETTSDTDASEWSGGAQDAERHWQKHGSQFSQYGSERDYVDGAHDFVSHPPPGTLTKHRANGDTLYYDPGSNTFAVQAPSGAPRTLFKPDDGEAYWDRQ